MKFRRQYLGAILLVAGSAGGVSAQSKPALDQRAQEILAESCDSCHGKAQMSGLDLTQPRTALKGGQRGPAIVPGKSAESLLYKAILQTGDLKMPPGKKLSPEDVETLRRWIDGGATWPAVAQTKAKEPLWWAFSPPQHSPVPNVKNATWARNPLDAFILTKLEEKGLQPSPAADKRTLIRRATFDLTGLPPSPAEVQAFLDDNSPDAYPKLVERLLASPQYGERWGRHWLDVVRYADSTGFESDLYYRNAWLPRLRYPIF